MAVALTAPAAEAACGGVEHFRPTERARPGPPPLAIGDSVMLGAVEPLRRAGFEVDVRGCRQMSEGLRLLIARRRADSLPDVVVVALGTNWTVSTREIRRARRILGPKRVLGLVVPPEIGGARTGDQKAIRAAGRRWPVRVKVLDWVARSAGKDWTWDGMHLKPAGAAAFARLLSGAFAWPIPGTDMNVEEAPPAQPAGQPAPGA